MKQIIPSLLLVCILFAMSGCQLQSPLCTDVSAPIVTVAPTETEETQPADIPTEPAQETQPIEETAIPTKPEQSTESPTAPTAPTITESPTQALPAEPQSTTPPVTEPPATEPPATSPPATEPPETEPPETQPPVEDEIKTLDCQVAMDIGNSHGASTYGWVVDPSLNEGNAGFHFGSWVMLSDGQERLNTEAIGQVDFLYREMKKTYPDLELTGIRFCVHAFLRQDGVYIVRVYYA